MLETAAGVDSGSAIDVRTVDRWERAWSSAVADEETGRARTGCEQSGSEEVELMGSKYGLSEVELQFNAELSERIEELRAGHKVPRCDLARIAGVTQQMLYAYEVGVTRWPVFRVCLIADFFGVKLETLMPKTQSYVVSSALQRKLI
jgi:DNA-binding XRE family transcriptional regulator